MSRVDVGTPSVSLSGWTTTEVCFHSIAALPTTKSNENVVISPEFSCFGHQWAIGLYPGGTSNSRHGNVGIRLSNHSSTSIKIQWNYSVRNANGREVLHGKLTTDEFGAYGGGDSNARYISNFAQRPTLMAILDDGSFVIEVRMKSTTVYNKTTTQFIPTNPIYKNVLQKFMDEETADVVFEVDNGSRLSEEHTNKKTKTTTTFYTHRFILQDISTMLAELCKSDEGITTVSITDVTPKIFKHMIYYAYGGKLSEDDLKTNAKDIINACDKYGVVHLKLEAEAVYVKSTEITMKNMMDNLLYADSKNLALLKEAVMDYILANKDGIVGKVSFDNFPGHLVADLLTAVSRGEQNGTIADITNYNKMRVGALRKMLDQKGLDVDGSRESMIALLKEHDHA